MKPNVGTIDKIIRIALAAIVAVLYFTNVITGTLGIDIGKIQYCNNCGKSNSDYFTNVITGTLGIVLLVLAGVFVLTSLVSFCPIWAVLGVNTGKKK